MSNEALNTETATTETVTVAKRKGGRPSDPNSMSNRAKRILSELNENELTKAVAVKKLVDDLGCKESSAMTFFYTFKAAKKKV